MKYKIKSYNYIENYPKRRLLFCLEETGNSGELRKYLEEITQKPNWQADFSAEDAALIAYAQELEN